MRALTVMLCI